MKKNLLMLLMLLFFFVGAANAWTDFALDFTKDTQYEFSGLGSSTTLYITSGGTVSATSAAGDLGTITGQFHDATYGLKNFTASITVPANVKITYGQNDYGNDVTITNSSSQIVGVINNYNGTGKWATGNTTLLSTFYYTGEATTLTFSSCDYVGYFAIQAMSAEEIAALGTTYNQNYNLESLGLFTNDVFSYYNCNKHDSHGWHIGSNGYIKVLVGAYADVTLSQCQHGTSAMMTITFPDGTTNTSVNQVAASDKASYTLTYSGGKPGFMTIGFPSGNAYLHSLSIQNYGTIATIGATGWATLSSDNILDFSSAIDNLTAAYIVTGATGTAITKTAIDAPIAASQGILLNGSGEVKIPGAATASFDASTNKMVAGTGAAVNYDSNAGYNYVLASNGGVAQFQHIVSGKPATVPVGKAYLALTTNPASAPWLSIIGDEDDTTGIDVVRGRKEEVRGVFYDLSGRRVENPAKGLFIVNGKKVIIK